jgi:hypothetical protein
MGGFELIFGIVPVAVIVIFVMATSVRILREYERIGLPERRGTPSVLVLIRALEEGFRKRGYVGDRTRRKSFVPNLCLTRVHSSAFQRTREDLARGQITRLLRGSGWTPGGSSFTPR